MPVNRESPADGPKLPAVCQLTWLCHWCTHDALAPTLGWARAQQEARSEVGAAHFRRHRTSPERSALHAPNPRADDSVLCGQLQSEAFPRVLGFEASILGKKSCRTHLAAPLAVQAAQRSIASEVSVP